ncbi:MAG: aldehyde dehydrogenase family protein [Acidobacteria bacterium]|nr:aldehyde dehydrogenase family protein [Acidobacteriota bacterium]
MNRAAKLELGVRNPRNGEVDYFISPPGADQVLEQCGHMREAQVAWRSAGLGHRIEVLQAWGKSLDAHRSRILESLAADTGRMRESAMEIDAVVSSIERWCRWAPELLAEPPERTAAVPFVHLRGASVPYPLVGVISPWNFPLLLSLIDAIPALLAGCAVLVKPSEVAPRFMRPLRQATAALPVLSKVLVFVEGAGETGAQIVNYVDLVCFTGSVETGREVANAAAARLIPAFLELGGKDAAIVLADANLELSTAAILWASVVNAGQSCLSIERVYAAAPIYDDFVRMLVERARSLRLALPDFESGEIGPIINEHQAEIIDSQLRDAIARGATVRCGGMIEVHGGGLWCRPTVLTGVDHTMKIMTAETFGPVIPVMSFETVEEAIRLANDTIYGLSAAIFAADEREALALAPRIEAGAVSINDAGLTAVIHDAEKQAFKFSGLGGSRMGSASIRRFVRRQAHLIKKVEATDPWWFGR